MYRKYPCRVSQSHLQMLRPKMLLLTHIRKVNHFHLFFHNMYFFFKCKDCHCKQPCIKQRGRVLMSSPPYESIQGLIRTSLTIITLYLKWQQNLIFLILFLNVMFCLLTTTCIPRWHSVLGLGYTLDFHCCNLFYVFLPQISNLAIIFCLPPPFPSNKLRENSVVFILGQNSH